MVEAHKAMSDIEVLVLFFGGWLITEIVVERLEVWYERRYGWVDYWQPMRSPALGLPKRK